MRLRSSASSISCTPSGNSRPISTYIHLEDQAIFGFAGLWEGESCTIITMPANALMTGVHNSKARMPAMLARDMRELWLLGTPEAAAAALVAYPDEHMIAYAVASRVNSAHNNDEKVNYPVLPYPRSPQNGARSFAIHDLCGSSVA